jgi:hypothetical protein
LQRVGAAYLSHPPSSPRVERCPDCAARRLGAGAVFIVTVDDQPGRCAFCVGLWAWGIAHTSVDCVLEHCLYSNVACAGGSQSWRICSTGGIYNSGGIIEACGHDALHKGTFCRVLARVGAARQLPATERCVDVRPHEIDRAAAPRVPDPPHLTCTPHGTTRATCLVSCGFTTGGLRDADLERAIAMLTTCSPPSASCRFLLLLLLPKNPRMPHTTAALALLLLAASPLFLVCLSSE